jgi:signal transduction histidine kinase
MGLVAGLTWQRRSRLDLAKSLPWLAGFGIAHGLNEWGYIFTPLQAFYLSSQAVTAMYLFQLILLAFSYFCLFQFGMELILPIVPHHRWLRIVPGATTFLLGVGGLLTISSGTLPLRLFILTCDTWSRYMLAFPGSILAALGLFRQGRRVKEMDLPRINAHLSGAAVAFLFYSLVGGLIVPKLPFIPALWLNYEVVLETVGIPVQVFRSICGVAMLVFVTRSLDVFRIETERLIEEMEHARLLAADRERIGRDLHDGIIQSIYAAGLGLEETLYLIPKTASQAREKVHAIMERLNHTIQEIRTYIFDLREVKSSRDLAQVLEDMIYDMRLDTLLEAELQVNGRRSWALSGEQVAHLTQIAREALNNVVRHANANHVSVTLDHQRESVRLTVADDGVGMQLPLGHIGGEGKQGLLNIKERTELLGGKYSLESRPGQGIKVMVTIPRPH